jgi:Arc/MetJ family transcription regulator
MATNLSIDPELLNKAVRMGGLPTKCATVTEALNEYIAKRSKQQLFDLMGTVDYDDDYDYKALRHSKYET